MMRQAVSAPPGIDMTLLPTSRAFEQLAAALREILRTNGFYRRKLGEQAADRLPDGFAQLPFTTKAELVADQAERPPYGTNLTYGIERYCRMHQTSGTTGAPLRWLDTRESWDWFLGCWETIYGTIGLRPDDRLFFPFSFGPFLGFWGAFEGAARLGNFCLPGGGMTTSARLRCIADHTISVVACTPTYALRLAEVARQESIDLAHSSVRALILAGEPGGSIAATRQQIEQAWGARVLDHWGMTELGALAIECCERPGGLHLLGDACIAEVIDPASGAAVPPDAPGELVVTNLGRWGSPLIRYRTGDLVRADSTPCPCGRPWLRLAGGVLGRTDDMVFVRGNNVYPSVIEGIVRQQADVAEFRVYIAPRGAMNELRIEIEPAPEAAPQAADLAHRLAAAIQDHLHFRPTIVPVAPGTLQRFEMKARRWVTEQ
jgi:phenylacetate-CoA ligase